MNKLLLASLSMLLSLCLMNTTTDCHGGRGAGAFFGGLAVGGIVAGAAASAHHRHHRDRYYEDIEEENAELRDELAHREAETVEAEEAELPANE